MQEAASPGYPTAALERRIHPPCNVKLLFVPDPAGRGHPEAMWVKVTAIKNGTYTGTLDSHPSPGKGLPDRGEPGPRTGRASPLTAATASPGWLAIDQMLAGLPGGHICAGSG